MNLKKLALEIIAKARSRSQTGDLSKHLEQQGFFDKIPSGLKRDKFLSDGNPVDIKKDFFKQNPEKHASRQDFVELLTKAKDIKNSKELQGWLHNTVYDFENKWKSLSKHEKWLLMQNAMNYQKAL